MLPTSRAETSRARGSARLGRVEPRFWANKPSRVEPSQSLRVDEPSRAYIPRLGRKPSRVEPMSQLGSGLGEPGLMGSIKRNEVSMLVSAQKSRNYMMKILTAKRGDESKIHTTEGSY